MDLEQDRPEILLQHRRSRWIKRTHQDASCPFFTVSKPAMNALRNMGNAVANPHKAAELVASTDNDPIRGAEGLLTASGCYNSSDPGTRNKVRNHKGRLSLEWPAGGNDNENDGDDDNSKRKEEWRRRRRRRMAKTKNKNEEGRRRTKKKKKKKQEH